MRIFWQKGENKLLNLNLKQNKNTNNYHVIQLTEISFFL